MTNKTYDEHDKAFKDVSAYVIAKGGKPVAKIAFKHGGSVRAFIHWTGTPMVRGRAGGGGYDRATAATEDAALRLDRPARHSPGASVPIPSCPAFEAFKHALTLGNDGSGWDRRLQDAGFDVWVAI
jgi:hypothetical protein